MFESILYLYVPVLSSRSRMFSSDLGRGGRREFLVLKGYCNLNLSSDIISGSIIGRYT